MHMIIDASCGDEGGKTVKMRMWMLLLATARLGALGERLRRLGKSGNAWERLGNSGGRCVGQPMYTNLYLLQGS
eukprot:6710654-Pyramimonas_sp.AAC.1